VIDTDMQRAIRASSAVDFPLLPQFEQLYREGMLRDPADVACEMLLKERLI
jgi:hypothetical protein